MNSNPNLPTSRDHIITPVTFGYPKKAGMKIYRAFSEQKASRPRSAENYVKLPTHSLRTEMKSMRPARGRENLKVVVELDVCGWATISKEF